MTNILALLFGLGAIFFYIKFKKNTRKPLFKVLNVICCVLVLITVVVGNLSNPRQQQLLEEGNANVFKQVTYSHFFTNFAKILDGAPKKIIIFSNGPLTEMEVATLDTAAVDHGTKIIGWVDMKKYNIWEHFLEETDALLQSKPDCDTLVFIDDIDLNDLAVNEGQELTLPEFFNEPDYYTTAVLSEGGLLAGQLSESLNFIMMRTKKPDMKKRLLPKEYCQIIKKEKNPNLVEANSQNSQ